MEWMEWYFALPLVFVLTLAGLFINDVITKIFSDEDPKAQSYWFSCIFDKDRKSDSTINF